MGVSLGSARRNSVPEAAKAGPHADSQTQSVTCESLPGGAGSEGMKGCGEQLRLGPVREQERT